MHLRHARFEDIEAFFTLGPAYDLANTGKQDIHGPYGIVILIHAHVKGFNLLWIVGQDHRFLKMLLYQIPLMFRLQICPPPFNEVLELFLFVWGRVTKDINRLGIGKTFEPVVDYKFQFLQQTHFRPFVLWLGFFFFCQTLIQEFQIFSAIFEHVADN